MGKGRAKGHSCFCKFNLLSLNDQFTLLSFIDSLADGCRCTVLFPRYVMVC